MDELDSLDGTALAALMRKGELTPTTLLDRALERAVALSDLNAVVSTEPAAARRELAEADPKTAFYGVPFLLKDLGAEARAFPTTNGSRLYRGTAHAYDSEIYLRCKRAGLVTFGRTASPEFGIGPVTEAQVYPGPARNPWRLSHTPGGSSGGAAAAVAAGIVPVAHGSDGGGSVRIPASCCGLVGFKATRARMPDGPGAGEGWGGMAIDGFLTRSLRDTAALLDLCSGADLGAPYWAPPLEGTFSEAIDRPPKRLRIAWLDRSFTGAEIHPDCRAAVSRTAKLLEDLGHNIEEGALPADLDITAMMTAWTTIVACGTALTVHAKTGGTDPDRPLIEAVTAGALALAGRTSGASYLAALNAIHAFGRRMARWFESFDILVTPTLAAPPAPIGRLAPVNRDFLDYRMGPGGVFDYSPFCAAFNASGQPAVSLPLHWNSDGLPIGVHLAARFGADETLMALAAELEAATPWAATQTSLIERLR
ncbi:MAG: amidase [Pikeienuella sp.]